MTISSPSTPEARQLRSAGYCLFPGVLDRRLLADLIQVTEELVSRVSPEDRERYRYQGSNIAIDDRHPVFTRLITCPKTLDAFTQVGFTDPKYWSGYLLSKAPHAPSLYWHQDWWAWHIPCSADEEPSQVFAMYYLTDTRRENGCLRLIPGTHRKRIPLHDELPPAHTDETYHSDEHSIIHGLHPDEVDVPVKAGDVVIGDARLLHAAHANQTDERRSCLTLWYFPHYASLPETIKAAIGKMSPPRENAPSIMRDILVPPYTGTAEPCQFNRVPEEYLAR
ncbi:MAG: phytanoyl-CoA dioxygenase family protein [Candidatus Latescibacteria bacterium]|nr:phytanoyl-CoA dioxygenase family protein [Candidatus Latescibacterota bacterium]